MITVLVCQEVVVDPASGEIIADENLVIEPDRLYETGVRIHLTCLPFPHRLFRRVTFPDRATYETQTRIDALGWRYTDEPGEPVCIITARAVEDAGGFDVYLPADEDRIWTSTARRREDWATVEQFAEWLCLETGADYCLLTMHYQHGGELTGLGEWPARIYKTDCQGRHVQRTWLGCPRCP